jgi:ATP-dependent helicase Lhr and Lhr-like helicase
MDPVLDQFSVPTRSWFQASFAAPTPAQKGAWAVTATGASVLVSAPTGSGKTLAAFLAALDRLLTEPPQDATRVLYVSPLKALAYDIDRNLRAPLSGIRQAAQRLGTAVEDIDVGIRTGDTPADERRRLARRPPDILITTPESLYLLLTSAARQTLTGVRTVIVDEVHAVAGTKRGAHLALSLERLEHLVDGPLQRVGLSATQRPLEEVADFLAGGDASAEDRWSRRPVDIVDAGRDPHLEVEIVVPVDDMSRLGEVVDEPVSGPAAGPVEHRRSIWPAVHPRILDLVEAHRSTIVFANSRRLAERLCASLNELHAERAQARGDEVAGPIARAHHGSVAREHRTEIEEQLKSGALACVVATSSLELGIDMGAVDLVVQVESPGSVASGLQRVGRAGHQVGAPSVGKVFPKYRGDLLEAAVVVDRMRHGEIESTRYPRNPLDVLAQQVVAMVALDEWAVDDLHRVVRGAANFADLSRTQLDGVLDMLSGRYPSDEFAELRPRVNWDRTSDRVRGRPGAQRLAVTNAGTIPDRGLYGVFIVGEGQGRRVGELDEEMVYETRPGETFTLGSTTWRIDDITRDQVLVVPAPGEPGKLPFWHGDAPGRPVEVGRAVGAFLRELGDLEPSRATALLGARYGLDEKAARNLVDYLAEQAEATGVLPSDRRIVIERFRDEIGDWRVCVLSPFGARVHAPWALAIRARARERLGMDVQTMHADDGIVVRLPDVEGEHTVALAEIALLDADEVEDLVVGELADSPLFASRFRECAARALLLPRRVGGQDGIRRTPLWQQRQRSSDLLSVASKYGQFPILLETYRECLGDVFDVPGLVDLMRSVSSRKVHISQVATEQASPFASSLLFDYVASYLYDGDAPLAERRAQALSLDRDLLAELLGSDELRELIDPDALDQLEAEVQRLADGRRARNLDAVADLLREVGDLRADEVEARTDGPAAQWLAELEIQRRVYRLRIAGEERWAAAEDAARFRDGLGAPPVVGLPDAFLEPVERPLVDLIGRYARTHGPFVPSEAALRLGLPSDAVLLALATLEREGRVTRGAFRPTGTQGPPSGHEWIDMEVLRRLRRRSLAALRREVEPVEPAAYARFLPVWQGVGSAMRGVDRTFEVIEQLQGAPLPASVLERDVLAARVRDYTPAWLDELTGAGEVVWIGRGPLGTGDGLVALYTREAAPLLAPPPAAQPDDPAGQAIAERLHARGAAFWPDLYKAAGGGDQQAVLDALWDLVWAGLVTNDSFAPLRALTGAQPVRRRGGGRRRAPRALQRSGPATAVGRWSAVDDVREDTTATQRAAALAAQLLERHGVLTRDAVGVEQLPGGFSAVYQVLKAMEDSGRARRGYFVEGLGGAQFAFPGAVDRLRGMRVADEPSLVLAATDPANVHGASLPWPRPLGTGGHGPRRVAGAYVILHRGGLVGYLERGGRSLLTFAEDAEALDAVAEGLAGIVTAGRLDAVRLQRVDGRELADQAVLGPLRARGFGDHPRGLVLRA